MNGVLVVKRNETQAGRAGRKGNEMKPRHVSEERLYFKSMTEETLTFHVLKQAVYSIVLAQSGEQILQGGSRPARVARGDTSSIRQNMSGDRGV